MIFDISQEQWAKKEGVLSRWLNSPHQGLTASEVEDLKAQFECPKCRGREVTIRSDKRRPNLVRVICANCERIRVREAAARYRQTPAWRESKKRETAKKRQGKASSRLTAQQKAERLIMAQYKTDLVYERRMGLVWSKHPEKAHYMSIIIARRTYHKRKKNPALRMKFRLRSYIWKFCKSGLKSKSTAKLLGCTWEQFRAHIENHFSRHMTWGNYGKYWSIDHIQPCSSFDLSNPTHQSICFHYSNMRPMVHTANILKGNKIVTGLMELPLPM